VVVCGGRTKKEERVFLAELGRGPRRRRGRGMDRVQRGRNGVLYTFLNFVHCGAKVECREEGMEYLVVRGWGPGRKGGSSQSLEMRNSALPLRPRKSEDK
jgi:hypothetical protein